MLTKKQIRAAEKYARNGWLGLIHLKDYWEYLCFIINDGWQPIEPEGEDVMLRARKDGRILILKWHKSKHIQINATAWALYHSWKYEEFAGPRWPSSQER